MNIYVKILVLSFLTLVLQHVARLMYQIHSIGNDWINHHPGKCQIVTGFDTNGSEDMTELGNGLVLVSSGLVGYYQAVKQVQRGGIFLWDPKKDMGKAMKLEMKGLSDDQHFSPHGIHHWKHGNGSVSVFVVNHQPESVLRFLYEGGTLTLTKTYKNKQFTNINSIYVTGEDSFYVSNMWHANFGDHLMIQLEGFLLMPLGKILYIQGDLCHVAADGLLMPNGIIGNSKFLYVATKDSVQLLTILPGKDLKHFKSIKISTGSMDNIKLDKNGDLWIGVQPHLNSVLKHLQDISFICPSEVLRVKNPEGKHSVESVLFDDGYLINAATVGLHTQNGKLLVGTIDSKMVICDIHYLSE